MAGYEGDAHELVNQRAVPIAKKTNRQLISVIKDIASEEPLVQCALDTMPDDIPHLLWHPEKYIGDAEEKAFEVVALAEAFLSR